MEENKDTNTTEDTAVQELPYFDSLSNLGKDEVELKPAVETMTVEPLKEVTKEEFETLKMHIQLVGKLNNLNSQIGKDCSNNKCDKTDTLEPLRGTVQQAEKEVWTKMAEKFGFKNIDQLTETNLRFRLKSGYFIEAYNG